MKHLGVMIAALSFSVGGCALPCGNGTCRTPFSLFNLPTARYSATETVCPPASFGCGQGSICKPMPYLTFAKYWPYLDDLHTTWTAKSCAQRFLLSQEWRSKRLLGQDYKAGFRQAFIDIVQGGSGETPAVPPPKFWNTHFRSSWGQQKAELWFDGYREGAAIAGSELMPMRQVAASADWTTENTGSSFVSQSNYPDPTCPTILPQDGMVNGGSLLNPQPTYPFHQATIVNQGSGPTGRACPLPNMPPPGPSQFAPGPTGRPGSMPPGLGPNQFGPQPSFAPSPYDGGGHRWVRVGQ